MIYELRAFTKDINGGNPAAVVLDGGSYSDAQMQGLAARLRYPETAFVMPSAKAAYRLRFFSPVKEVELCGHATVAAFNLLRDLKILKTGEYFQETKAGVLGVQVEQDQIFMEQNRPLFLETLSKNEIKCCFTQADYLAHLPIQIVSTGLKDIILPVKNLKALLALQPKQEKILKLSIKLGVVGIHAFSLETMGKATAHTRNFAPRYGILEEAATGTANGALAAYLVRQFRDQREFIMEQGHSLGRPSLIKVRLKKRGGKISKVEVGGSAVLISGPPLGRG